MDDNAQTFVYFSHSLDLFTNLVVALVYCFYLGRERQRALLNQTRRLINVLVVYAIQSGLYGMCESHKQSRRSVVLILVW